MTERERQVIGLAAERNDLTFDQVEQHFNNIAPLMEEKDEIMNDFLHRQIDSETYLSLSDTEYKRIEQLERKMAKLKKQYKKLCDESRARRQADGTWDPFPSQETIRKRKEKYPLCYN